jgi:thiosulfate/3-mercaptopyruvate sulfurtransferase
VWVLEMEVHMELAIMRHGSHLEFQVNNTLVGAAELRAHPEWRVFDCRHNLADPAEGERLYAAGHIPGALHAHLDRDLSAPKTGRNGRHPLPRAADFLAWLGRQGVRPTDPVVAYDAADGMFASRLWWMLRWVGHTAAAVLDGGMAQWQRQGGALTADVPRFAPTVYTGAERAGASVEVRFVQANLAARTDLLVDARAAGRFAGQGETIDPVAGHIPGARNRPYADNLGADGRFKPAEQLRAEWLALLAGQRPEQVVHYCGSGVSSCHNLLALEVAGLGGARLYAGSWSEWCSDPARPVAVGSD